MFAPACLFRRSEEFSLQIFLGCKIEYFRIFQAGIDGIFGGEDEEEGLGDDIQALIDERQAARKAKNWARADEIRDQLAAMGITLKDTPQGVQVIRN